MTLELGDSRKGGMKINELQKHRRSCLKRRPTCPRKDSPRKVQSQDLDLIERELQEQDTLVENLNDVLRGCKEKCKRINEKVNEFIREVRKMKLQQEFYQINYLNLFERRPLRHRDFNANPYPEVLVPNPIFHIFSNSGSITESLSNSMENHRKKEKSEILLLQNRIPEGYVTMLPIRGELRKDNKFGVVTAKHKFKNERRRIMKIEVSVKAEETRDPDTIVKRSEEKSENGKKSCRRGKWKTRKILSGAEDQDDQRASKLLPFGIDTGTRISRAEFKSMQDRIQKRLDAVTNLNSEWEICRNMCTSINHNLDVAIKELTEIRQQQRDYGRAYKYIFKGVLPPRNTFQTCKLQISEKLSKTFKCCNS